MKKSRIAILVTLSILLIAVAVGLMMYFKPHKDFASATPDFELTVSELVGAFVADDAAATQKFVSGDKTVLVRGLVREIETDTEGNAIIVLSQEGTDGSVSCTLTPAESRLSSSVRIGDEVRIQGQCTGMQELIEPQVIIIRSAVSRE